MNNGLIIMAIIISIVVVVATVTYYFSGVSKVQSEKDVYCQNWADDLLQRKAQIQTMMDEYNNAGYLEQMSMDKDQIDTQINALTDEGYQYNRECYY